MLIEASLRNMRVNSSTIELVEDRIGIYWIVPANNACYLVPKIDFLIEDKYLQGLEILFDRVNNSNLNLFNPAIVMLTKSSMPKQWKLEQKGLVQ